jgi:hypothetical protein
MTPIEFLRAVWPTTGAYCIATKAGKGYAHDTFDTIDQAAAFAVRVRAKKDVYFCVHALTEKRVWNAKMRKDGDGEWVGGWTYRPAANMRAAKAFFFDIDVGEGKDYPTQGAALAALKAFCDTTSLPLPMLVNSGRGVHCYWRLDEELASAAWKDHAKRLFNLATAHGLKVDPSRTTDTTSLLRVADTFNFKGDPLPVKVWAQGSETSTRSFLALLDAAADEADLALAGSAPSALDALGSNLAIEFDGPPVNIVDLGKACGQVRAFAERRGNVHYAAWHKMLAVLRHVEDGADWAHKLSSGHPDYDKDQLDQKLWHQERDAIGPTTCGVMRANCDPAICDACPYWGIAKSPLSAARMPRPTQEAPDVDIDLEPPCKPPAGFTRVEGGGVVFMKRSEDKVTPVAILNCDLYPLARQVDGKLETDQHEWCAKLPREEAKTFSLDSGVIQEPVLLAKELSRHGVYVTPGDNKLVQLYMSLYIKDLQRMENAETQFSYLGWTDKHADFVLHDVILSPGGKAEPSRMNHRTLAHLRGARGMGTEGTLAKQVKLMGFYNQPRYYDRQFYILCGLAAPFYHATGYHGSIVHATGLPGAAKSTTLFAAMSLWGHPQKLPLNGQSSGATANARDQLISIMNNLPVGLDEITNIADDVAKEFALNVSQVSNQKIRLRQSGELRTEGGGDKSTLVLTTGNASLHSILSRNNVSGDAGSMRVFEMVFQRPDRAGKAEADRFMFNLCENYGHIGPALMRYGVDHYAEIVKLVQEEKIRIDALVDLEPHERFWSADAAAALALGSVAHKLGLLPFDIKAIRKWLVEVQFPAMRGTVKEQYPTAAEILTAYIEANGDSFVFVPEGNTSITREPRNTLKGRYEAGCGLMWLTKSAFSDYCAARRAPYQQYLHELAVMHVVVDRNSRKVLTAGTNITPTRSWCFAVNMKHAEMGELGERADKLAQGRPNLRIVKTEAKPGESA